MRRSIFAPVAFAALSALAAAPSLSQDAGPKPAPSPGEIVAAAPTQAWVDIAADDLLVMTLAPDAKGKPRTIYLQLIGAPFAQNWVSNIRTLARAHWYDGIAVVRVQDNYVVQWGDPAEEEESAKPLPQGLIATKEADYVYPRSLPHDHALDALFSPRNDVAHWSGFNKGFPIAGTGTPDTERNWPVHCYGMVGVGRGMSPDAGTGAELYTVIGQAPRHLDRNIAVVGRIVEGIENLSSLPRGTGSLGFYEDPGMRVPIISVRLASDLPEAERPHFQYLSTESPAFATYVEARANRRDPFFIVPAGGADICNVPVPIRRRP